MADRPEVEPIDTEYRRSVTLPTQVMAPRAFAMQSELKPNMT